MPHLETGVSDMFSPEIPTKAPARSGRGLNKANSPGAER
jgi:hypothetical protein